MLFQYGWSSSRTRRRWGNLEGMGKWGQQPWRNQVTDILDITRYSFILYRARQSRTRAHFAKSSPQVASFLTIPIRRVIDAESRLRQLPLLRRVTCYICRLRLDPSSGSQISLWGLELVTFSMQCKSIYPLSWVYVISFFRRLKTFVGWALMSVGRVFFQLGLNERWFGVRFKPEIVHDIWSTQVCISVYFG